MYQYEFVGGEGHYQERKSYSIKLKIISNLTEESDHQTSTQAIEYQ